LVKKGYIALFIKDRKTASNNNQIVEHLGGKDVEHGEPTIEVMDSNEEALVAEKELEGYDEAHNVRQVKE